MPKTIKPIKTIKMFKDGQWIKWDGSDVKQLLVEETITMKDLKYKQVRSQFNQSKIFSKKIDKKKKEARILSMNNFLVKMLKDFETDKTIRTALISVLESWKQETNSIYSDFSKPYAEELVSLIYEILENSKLK
jgi:hypothetical protein